MPEVLQAVQQKIGHVFHDQALLLTALTHSSYASEQNPPVPWNERLEFLGDAVLEVVVSRKLYLHFTECQEGTLTRARAMLVNEKATSGYAVCLGLDDALLLGKGENLTGGRKRKALLGDAFEAMLGAVFLDGGLEAATAVVEKVLPTLDEGLMQMKAQDNPKGVLQEYAQAKNHASPLYTEVEGTLRPPHFVMEVRVGELTARGEGDSKKAAEVAAAQAALELLQERPSGEPIPEDSQEMI